MKTSNPVRIMTLLITLSLFLSACSLGTTPQPSPTSNPEAANTPEASATLAPVSTSTTIGDSATKTPKPTLSPMPTTDLTETNLYSDFTQTLQKLYDAKHIDTMAGAFKHLPDYQKEFAQINYLQWYETGESPTNFILRSDISWESASAAANNSGCGFFFHIKDKDNFYVLYVSLKGVVDMQSLNNNTWSRLGSGVYGSAKPKGKVNLTLIVQDQKYKVFINDKLMKTYLGSTGKLLHGELAYTVLSGTNKSFGTRCNFTNTVLWTLP